AGKERERKREEEREDEPEPAAERAAQKISGLRRADARDDETGGFDGDVGSAEPAQNRARGSEKKDDEDLIADRRDLGDLEERGAEEETEDEADESCDETDEGHGDHSFL